MMTSRDRYIQPVPIQPDLFQTIPSQPAPPHLDVTFALQQRVEQLEAEVAFLRAIILRAHTFVPAWARIPNENGTSTTHHEPTPSQS